MKKLMTMLTLCGAMGGLSACGFEIVDTGNRGVETRFGEIVGTPLPEGLHFYNPFTSDITEISVRENKFGGETESFTKDNQAINMHVELVWSINPSSVNTIYQEVGGLELIESNRVRPNFLGALKDAIGKQDAETIIQNRERAAQMALEETRRKLEPMGITVHTLNFSNLALNPAYQKAVEEKMIAKQLAETAKNNTVRIEEEAKQTIKTAQADAEAMRIKSQALAQNKGLVEFEMVKKWTGNYPKVLIINGGNKNNGGTGQILNLPKEMME